MDIHVEIPYDLPIKKRSTKRESKFSYKNDELFKKISRNINSQMKKRFKSYLVHQMGFRVREEDQQLDRIDSKMKNFLV